MERANAKLNDAKSYFIDDYSSSKVPHEIKVVKVKDGSTVHTLLNSKNPLEDYAMGKVKFFPLKAADGQELWCRMILPPDFDAKKKYPVINYVYGGPGVQLLRDTWLGAAPLL